MADDGTVTVYGGVRRVQAEPMPMVKSPNELPAAGAP